MKFKLNITKIAAVGLLALPLAFTSCSEDAMDKVNNNTNNPLDVQAKYTLSDVIVKTAFNNVGGDVNTYLSSYVEHEAGVHNQLWNAENRRNEPSAASTFNNSWLSIYETLRNTQVVIDKTSEGGSQAGNYATLGVGQIMQAYNLALLTDLFGDVPFSEALTPFENKNPKLDKQEDLYKKVLSLLDEAIVNIPKGDTHGSGSYGTHDLLYGGTNAKWLKLAYGLKARYTMRTLNLATDKSKALNDVISFVDQSFSQAQEEAAFARYSIQNLNPLFDFFNSRRALGASQSLVDKLIERNDPRLARNFVQLEGDKLHQIKEMTDKVYKGVSPNGDNIQEQDKYHTSIFVYAQTAPTLLLSFHELLFLKAEAMQRLDKSVTEVQAVLKNAIAAAVVNSERSAEAAFVAPSLISTKKGAVIENSADINGAQIDKYFEDDVKPRFVKNPLAEIAVQKYLAFSGASGESTEMYNDIRRWKAAGESLVELKNKKEFPLRLPYGSSETSANPHVHEAFGNGQYVYSENVWWAGGTR